MDVIKLLAGIFFSALGIFMIATFFIYPFGYSALITGIFVLIIGLFILLNKSENKIEERKDLK